MEDSSNKVKQCPFCGEDIHVNAVKCPYCRTWIDGRDSNTSSLHSSEKPQTAASISQQSGLDDFLDSLAAHVTYSGRLQKLCIAAIVLTIYSCSASCVSDDEYYRSGFLNALAWFDNNIGWLMELLEGLVGLCILLALRMVLKRHNIHTWISLCIVAEAISVVFNIITPNSLVSIIPATASGLLMIEFGYKMYKSSIVHIKNVGLIEMIVSALWVVFILFLPWVFVEFISGGNLASYGSLMALLCFLTIEYYVLLKKLFKIENSENQ